MMSSSSLLLFSTHAALTKASGRKRLAAAMAFLAGWADVTFLVKFQTFGTMLTGNTMQLGLAVAKTDLRTVAYYSSIIMSYLLGTAVFRRTDLSLRKKTMPICSLIVAVLFVLGDWIHLICSFSSSSIGSSGARWIPMMLFAGAFGIINALGTEVSGTLTFVVTGHLTRLVNQAVDRLSRTAGRQKMNELQRLAAVQNGAIFVGFVTGAAFGSLLLKRGLLERYGVFSIIGLLHAVLWLSHDMESLGGAWWLRKAKTLREVDSTGKFCELDGSDDMKIPGVKADANYVSGDELKP